MEDISLTRLGKLYAEDLKALAGESCTTKLVYAQLTSLTECSYAKKHFGQISLTTAQISEFMGGYLSPRMIRRQLNLIAARFPNQYQERKQGKHCLIKLRRAEKPKKFKLIFTLGNQAELQAPSMILLVSVLLDKAAFNYRGGDNFAVSASQLTDIAAEIGVSQKTICSHLRTLQKLNLIVPLSGCSDLTGTEILKQGFNFSTEVFGEYSSKVKLTRSRKCEQLVQQRRYSVKNRQIVRSDRSFSQSDPARREIKNRLSQGFAEQPILAAEKPRAAAETASLPDLKSSQRALDAAISELKALYGNTGSPHSFYQPWSFPQSQHNRGWYMGNY